MINKSDRNSSNIFWIYSWTRPKIIINSFRISIWAKMIWAKKVFRFCQIGSKTSSWGWRTTAASKWAHPCHTRLLMMTRMILYLLIYRGEVRSCLSLSVLWWRRRHSPAFWDPIILRVRSKKKTRPKKSATATTANQKKRWKWQSMRWVDS